MTRARQPLNSHRSRMRPACLLLLLAAPLAAARMGRLLLGASDHVYKVHEKVALYANKVGPFHNPRCGYGHVRSSDGHSNVGMSTRDRSRPRHLACKARVEKP